MRNLISIKRTVVFLVALLISAIIFSVYFVGYGSKGIIEPAEDASLTPIIKSVLAVNEEVVYIFEPDNFQRCRLDNYNSFLVKLGKQE